MVGRVEQVVLPVLCIPSERVDHLLECFVKRRAISCNRNAGNEDRPSSGLGDNRWVNGERIGDEGPQPLGIDYGRRAPVSARGGASA